MLVAEISASVYYLMTLLGVACAGTVIACLVGLGLFVWGSSRKAAQRVLLMVLYSVPFEIALLLLALVLDT